MQSSGARVVGRQLGPYKIIEPLGAGGMGEVYLAEDMRLGRIAERGEGAVFFTLR